MGTPERRDIEFKTFDGLTLRGWFYPATSKLEKSPAIVITHGVSAIPYAHLHFSLTNLQKPVGLRERNGP